MPWWNERMVGFDIESTSPLPEEARIVSAAIAFYGGGEPTETWTALADPGVEIPEEATGVHGITTQRAREEGRPAGLVVADIADLLTANIARGVPLVVFNARYDLTVLDRECRRYGIPAPWVRQVPALRVIDPLGIDKWLDRYRRSYPHGYDAESGPKAGLKSSRTLEGMAAHYGATLDGAHDAAFDAIAAGRIAWVIGAKGQVVRRVRNANDRREREWLVAEWERVRGDLDLLTAAQREWAIAERIRFAEYKRSVGEHEAADRIEAEQGWPVLAPLPWEELAA